MYRSTHAGHPYTYSPYLFATFFLMASLLFEQLQNSNAYLSLVYTCPRQKEVHLCIHRCVWWRYCTHHIRYTCHMTKQTGPHTDTADLHLSLDSTLLNT